MPFTGSDTLGHWPEILTALHDLLAAISHIGRVWEYEPFETGELNIDGTGAIDWSQNSYFYKPVVAEEKYPLGRWKAWVFSLLGGKRDWYAMGQLEAQYDIQLEGWIAQSEEGANEEEVVELVQLVVATLSARAAIFPAANLRMPRLPSYRIDKRPLPFVSARPLCFHVVITFGCSESLEQLE